MVGMKSELGGLEIVWKITNVVSVFNDTKTFCCLDLKCSVIICFTLFC